MINKQPWALILGASSGFGEATALELARAGMNIFGVHMDRRDKLQRVDELKEKIHHYGRESYFVNDNATLDDTRQECVQELTRLVIEPAGTLRVILHSLAFGALKPLVGAEEVINRHQLELTSDVMGHSLVYWVQDCLKAGLLDRGARIFAMTSIGGSRAVPNYGPVGAAKAVLESHIRQLAMELAPAGITANAIRAGVTDSAALRQIPGYEKILEVARHRNPSRRLTQPEDVARAIAALCHPATYWLTGNVLNVDGGENIVG
jgi:NAD(P)-dependent dehydrogenase (short-subunit alcohol dehydrogenase family)